MKDCEILDLLRVEDKYLKFIVDVHTELNFLEHFENCRICLENIKNNIKDNQELSGFGNLFNKSSINEKHPKYSECETIENFIYSRIQNRKSQLLDILEKTEIELSELKKRIESRSTFI
jgi:hypothetical protein